MAKSKGLQISRELSLPLDAVTSTLVVYGGKGMGKTNFGGVLVEELALASLKWAVLDPMGVWWGIRHAADGKGDGVRCLILGGAHGDIPIEPTGGAVVADLIADEAVNAVIDISRKANGEMWSIGERIRFANDYGRQLFKRQGSLIDGRRREPMMQVIDEAARFIPQMVRAGQPELAMCTSTWSTIVEEGRNVGLGVTLLTQRSARLNKDVAELADVMLAFRTVGPNSLEAVTDWLSSQVTKQEMRQIAEEVRSLPVGSCLVESPGWLKIEKIVAVRMRETFDSSATPKPGHQIARVRGDGAKPDLGKYAERMRETIERAKEDDPRALKAKIRDLQAQVANKTTSSATVLSQASSSALASLRRTNTDMKQENVELKRKLDDRQRKAQKLVAIIEKTTRPLIVALGEVLDEFKSEAPQFDAPTVQVIATRIVAKQPTPVRRVPETPVGSEVKLRGRSMEMLRACARMYPKGLTEAQVASQSGMKRTGGTFGDYKSLLRTSGSIRIEGGIWYASDEGMRRAGADIPAAPSTTDEVLAMWLPKLRGKAKDMLRVLVDRRGDVMSREELGAAVDVTPSGGTFGDYLSLLRTADLVITDGSGVRANAETLLL